MTVDSPSPTELASAIEAELRAVAVVAPRDLRMRLLVSAHSVGVLCRELAVKESAETSDSSDLTAAICAGVHDGRLVDLVDDLRADVRQRLAVSTPGYDHPSGGS